MIRKDAYLAGGGFSQSINLYEDWHHMQRLAWHAGDKNWAHSGCIGTYCNGTNPRLSSKTRICLLLAQLCVLAMNIDIVDAVCRVNPSIDIQYLISFDPDKRLPCLHDIVGRQCQDKSLTIVDFLGKINNHIDEIFSVDSMDEQILQKLNSLFLM